jgi:hypothetical protein
MIGQLYLSFDAFCDCFDYQDHSSWLIFATNRSLSSETVMCLATQQSRDLVLRNELERGLRHKVRHNPDDAGQDSSHRLSANYIKQSCLRGRSAFRNS